MRYRYKCYRRRESKGRDASGHNRRCNGRRTLTKLIEFYQRRPRCPNCGEDSLTLDVYRMAREVGKEAPVCRCGGMPFPHREGCKWCYSYTGEYDEIDQQWGQPTYGKKVLTL